MRKRNLMHRFQLSTVVLALGLLWNWLSESVLQINHPPVYWGTILICLGSIFYLNLRPGYYRLEEILGSTALMNLYLIGFYLAKPKDLWFGIPLVFCLSVVWIIHLRNRKRNINSLLEAIDCCHRGVYREQLPILIRDESSFLISEMNQLSSFLREKELLSQYIAPEVWQELQKESSQSLRAAREKWVLCLTLFVPEVQESLKHTQMLLEHVSDSCRKNLGFLNEFSREHAQVLFFEESEGYEKHALLALSEFLREKQFLGVLGAKASLRHCFVKSGVVLKADGMRMRCFSKEMVDDIEFLKTCTHSGMGYIHKDFIRKAERVFHLGDSIGEHCLINGEKNLDFHLDNLKSSRVEDKLVSIRVVETHRLERGISPLISLLEDVSPRVRIEAAKSLSRMVQPDNEDRIGQAFLRCLEKEWNHDCRATLVISLGEIRKKSLVAPLFHLLQDENDRVRANAIEAIGKCMDRGTVLRHLESMLNDRNNRARANAALALWMMGLKKGLVELIRMADSADPLLSCSGLYGLGETFREENLKVLYRVLSHPMHFYLRERKTLFLEAIRVSSDKVMEENPLVERNAIIALMKIRSNLAVPVLLKKFAASKDENIHQLILETLLALEEFSLVSRLRRKGNTTS